MALLAFITLSSCGEVPDVEGGELLKKARDAYSSLESARVIMTNMQTDEVEQEFVFKYDEKGILTYSYVGKSDKTSYAQFNNGIESYNATETIGGNAYIRQSYVDGVKNRFTNLNLFLPFTIAKWWSVTNQVRLSYNRYITLERTTNDLNWSVYTQHTVILPAAIRFMLTYRYYSRQKTAYGKSDGTHKLSFSLMRQFLDKRLTTKLSVSNLLWAQKPWTRVNTGDVLNEYSMYGRHLPFCTLSVYYQVSWGKHFSHRQIERSNSEENSRAM